MLARHWFAVLAACGGLALAWGQVGRDYLTAAEANQVQDAAGHLDQRIPLLTGFASARLESFEELRASAPGTAGREEGLHRDLQQFGSIIEELDDNISDLVDNRVTSETGTRKINAAKILEDVIKAENQMSEQLQRIQRESSTADLETYHFTLQDSQDTVADSLKSTQEALAKAGHGQ